MTIGKEVLTNVAVRGCGGRIAQTLPGVNEVRRGDGFAVAPFDVVTQRGNHMRGAIRIVRNRDVFRLTKRERAIGIRAVEALIQVRDVDHAIDRLIHVRVERGRFRTNADLCAGACSCASDHTERQGNDHDNGKCQG
ncbi:hypothetical protein SDC9_189120 [bioreactor metagenome]|uniref:Uncharacterized protein n=1 Tax=bioreactor metagenome TaxID=1076179 RepID=A0A645HRI6_9ZZZZ